MASKNQPTHKTRASKQIPAAKAPSLEELLRGARELARELTEIVDFAEQSQRRLGRERGSAATLTEGFRAVRWVGYYPDEMLAATVGPFLAGEHRRAARVARGIELIDIAAAAATGTIPPERAVALAIEARGDHGLNRRQATLEARDYIQRTRSRVARAQRLYEVLARGADALPVPDKRSGARGVLKDQIASALANPVSWLRD